MLILLLKFLVLAFTNLFLFCLYLWFFNPSLLVKWGLRLGLYLSGLRLRSVAGRKYTYMYGERGERSTSQSSLLLVHGFSASKDMMVPLVKKLPADIHVIVLDLPGHGGSSIPSEADEVSADELTNNLYEFTELVGLTKQPFHLAGTSLGGVISYLYAIQHSPLLDRLTLICPAFDTPESTEFMDEVRRGECRLIPNTVPEMTHMLNSCIYNKAVLPKQKQIIKGSLDLRLPRNPYFQRLIDSLTKDLHDTEKHQKLEAEGVNITCPVQIIWGKQDELVHISGVEKLKGLIPRIERVDLLDDCGHSVTMERPGASVKHLLQFRGQLPDDKKQK